MSHITTINIDLAKSVFQVCGLNQARNKVFNMTPINLGVFQIDYSFLFGITFNLARSKTKTAIHKITMYAINDMSKLAW